MIRRIPKRDPIRAHERHARAQRKIGELSECKCGEKRPEALLSKQRLILCAACQRISVGKVPVDKHHPAGRANHAVTIVVPINDHRARLSSDQLDWPRLTLENPDGSPLLRAAACIRGFMDTVVYLIEKLLTWIAEMLETTNAYLVEQLEPKWWLRATEKTTATKGIKDER